MDEKMTDKELVTIMIDKYTDLQRIRKANEGHSNSELDYQIKVTKTKLESMGVIMEELLRKRLFHIILGIVLRLLSVVFLVVFSYYAYLFAIERLLWYKHIIHIVVAILIYGIYRYCTRIYFMKFDYEPYGFIFKFFYRGL